MGLTEGGNRVRSRKPSTAVGDESMGGGLVTDDAGLEAFAYSFSITSMNLGSLRRASRLLSCSAQSR